MVHHEPSIRDEQFFFYLLIYVGKLEGEWKKSIQKVNRNTIVGHLCALFMYTVTYLLFL